MTTNSMRRDAERRGIRKPNPALDGVSRPRQLAELRVSIKRAVHAVEPDAEIILYGSRARGNARLESDWDLLILVDGPVDPARKAAIRHRLYEVEWDSDAVLTSIIFSRTEWNSPLYRAMPLHENVDRDGVPL